MDFKDVESARLAYYQKMKKVWLISGVIIVAILIGGFFLIGPFSFYFAFFALVLAIFINASSTQPLATKYKKAYKAYFVEKNLRSTFSELSYSHDKGLSKDFLKSTNMINTGNRFSSNDYTVGHYKNVLFTQADVHIETEHTDSDGDTTYITIFKGRFMVFEFPKKFNFKLELIGKKFAAYRVPGKNAETGRKMQKISTESNEFNHTFRIYGEDGFEAYYILDPAFMVKLMDINERYKGKILFCFIDNHLIIGLDDGKDSFEPPRAFKSIDEAAENEKISSDIKVITDFVDQLSLSHNLFK